jgi:hypothetical protein
MGYTKAGGFTRAPLCRSAFAARTKSSAVLSPPFRTPPTPKCRGPKPGYTSALIRVPHCDPPIGATHTGLPHA